MTRQVVGERHAGSKDDASWIYAACLHFAAQVHFSLIGVAQQPQNAGLVRLQEPHIAGVIFQLLLKDENTKPRSGNPASWRVGTRSATDT
jgi:hypothetical protein